MSDHTYKIVEVSGSSPDGVDAAVRNAIAAASSTIEDLRWFEVTEIRGHVEQGRIGHFQVVMKLGFHVHASRSEA